MRCRHWWYCETATSAGWRTSSTTFLSAVVGLAVAVAGVVLEVVVVGEEDPGDRRVAQMEVVEADQMALGEAVADLVEARQHHAQPGPAALAERHDDAVGAAQLARLLAAAQPALEADLVGLGQEEQRLQDDEARDLLEHAVQRRTKHGTHRQDSDQGKGAPPIAAGSGSRNAAGSRGRACRFPVVRSARMLARP